jgi:hypothetical protein
MLDVVELLAVVLELVEPACRHPLPVGASGS